MPLKKPKLPWEKDQPPRWKGLVYSLAIVGIITAGVFLLNVLSKTWPQLFTMQ